MGMNVGEVSPSHPPAGGPMVTFYLGKSIRGASLQTDQDQYVPVGINGYAPYMLKMGARNTVPKDVYTQLINSRSRSVVVDVEKAMRNPHVAGTNAPQKTETLMDYEVELIKEDK